MTDSPIPYSDPYNNRFLILLSQAMLAEVTPADKRSGVFAMRYWAINVGAAAGPIVGGYFGTVATGWTFYLAATANFIYLFVVFFVFPKQTTHPNHVGQTQPITFAETWKTVMFDKALLLFLIAAFLSNVGYAQIETTLPQVMASTMHGGGAATVYGIVLSSNAIEVVVLQLPISKVTKRLGLVRSMMLGQAIFALGYFMMGMAYSLQSYLIAMFVLTLGEIIVFPQNNQYVSELSPNHMRATYFGAWSMAQFGFFVGPWFGGMVLSQLGGKALFTAACIVVAMGIPFYRWSYARRRNVELDVGSIL